MDHAVKSCHTAGGNETDTEIVPLILAANFFLVSVLGPSAKTRSCTGFFVVKSCATSIVA
jgi:hypothetical protein